MVIYGDGYQMCNEANAPSAHYPKGKFGHTFTAVLLEFSNDAMVKRCVTKSILQKI